MEKRIEPSIVPVTVPTPFGLLLFFHPHHRHCRGIPDLTGWHLAYAPSLTQRSLGDIVSFVHTPAPGFDRTTRNSGRVRVLFECVQLTGHTCPLTTRCPPDPNSC